MRLKIGLYAALGFLLTGSLIACAEISLSEPTSGAESIAPSPSPSRAFVQDETRTASRGVAPSNNPVPQQATPTPDETPSVKIRVWWPDELYPRPGSTAEDILQNQLNGFTLTYSTYDLDFRRKRASGLGGILPTLRTAGPVAPGALPDLTLMRYTDMIVAAQEGLIVPIAEWIPSDLLDDNLIPGVQALGEIDGVLYGLPYAINLYHAVYRATVFESPLLTFDAVLEQQPHYVFPAGKAQGSLVSWTLLLQYLDAGGRLVDDTGVPVLDREALSTVLSYYERGLDEGIFDPTMTEYTQFDSYWNNFVIGEIDMVTVDSITYLTHQDSVPNTGLAPIPTADGTPISALDGWMWVLTTQNPDNQERASAFLTWMMRVNQHSVFTEAFGIVPSQQGALRQWGDTTYANFARSLIPVARLISGTVRSNLAAVALADSLFDVLDGMPADEAVDEALDTLGIIE